jgi:hypothetical protein
MRSRLTLAVLVLVAGTPLQAQEHHHPPTDEQVGAVRFPVSCAPEVRAGFERAVAMLHSFWFPAAEREFTAVAERDPGCAMAHWGLAMTMMGNPFTAQLPSAEPMRRGREAAERARDLAASATARERGYVAAVVVFYQPGELALRARMAAHEAELERLATDEPDDPEAAIFHARALVANAPPSDLEFRLQKRAAAILEPLFARMPEHPGLAHYLIHAYDAPALAAHGVDAAFRYADIAPAAPHALHMPSHIFTRLGYWDESIETNRRSAHAEPDRNAAVHPMDYMVYAYLQQGRDAAAMEEVARAVELPDRFYGGLLGYNFTAMPARYALERGAWREARALKVPGAALPYVTAIARFARGIGAARDGDAGQARREAEELAALAARLDDAGDDYWHTVVQAQRLAVEAWLARAESRDAEAVVMARRAADLEETVEKHPVTPGPLLPARELLADLLLELGHYQEALDAYEQTLTREPRRARSLFGAARAAELVIDPARARAHYEELLTVMGNADPERPEPRHARRFLDG